MHVGPFMLTVVVIVYVLQTSTPTGKNYTTVQINEPKKSWLTGESS